MVWKLDFDWHTLLNADVPDIYSTSLDAAAIAPTLVLNQNAKARERERETERKREREREREREKERGRRVGPFQNMNVSSCKGCTRKGASYGSLRILVKAINLQLSKVRQFLQSKPSYTKFALAIRKFKRIKAFARLNYELWCMHLAYVDKLAKDNNGVKLLLVRQDLFDRTVVAKGMKTKDSEKTACVFLPMNTKMNRPTKFRVDKGIRFTGEFKRLCKAVGVQVYSTSSESKAAFAELTIRSLKKIL